MTFKTRSALVVIAALVSAAMFVANAPTVGKDDVVQTTSTESEKGEANGETSGDCNFSYCPVAFMGSMNRIYYYAAQWCKIGTPPGDCSSQTVSSSRMHTIDHQCGCCNPTGDDCSDGFTSLHFGTDPDPSLAPPAKWPYVGRKESNDPNRFFCRAGFHVDMKDAIEDEVFVVDSAGSKHYFRVMSCKLTYTGPDGNPVTMPPSYFGQEINPQTVTSQAPIDKQATLLEKVQGFVIPPPPHHKDKQGHWVLYGGNTFAVASVDPF